MTRFNDKVVAVTGGASGFGAAACRRFAAEGASVVVADVDLVGAEEVAADIGQGGGHAMPVEVDVRDSAAVLGMVTAAEKAYGGLDVMVNNAGIIRPPRPVEEISDDEYDAVMDINVRGVWHGVKHAVPALRRRGGGVILNTSSSAVQPASPLSAVYTASKGAVYSLTRQLALELSPTIRVNCVVPSLANTNITTGSLGTTTMPEEIKQAAIARIPLGRLCTSEDIAASMAFLASDEASYLTGVCLPVDGGKAV